MASKMAAAIWSYLGNCVKQSILDQFSLVIYHFNWFCGQCVYLDNIDEYLTLCFSNPTWCPPMSTDVLS